MKTHYYLWGIAIFLSFTSFRPNEACDHMGNTLNFIGEGIRKALDADNINTRRYFTYKSLNAIERSKKLLEYCNCTDAAENLMVGLEHLKHASKAVSLENSGILLKNALLDTKRAMEFLETHDFHKSKYSNDILRMNTKKDLPGSSVPSAPEIEKRIDSSLGNYRQSLKKVVNTVECGKALAYVDNVLDLCERQMARPNLSPARLHYYRKTREITQQAKERLSGCNDE
ncbi:MAG: hypothetical protein V7724_10655 [Sediminicola sp.]